MRRDLFTMVCASLILAGCGGGDGGGSIANNGREPEIIPGAPPMISVAPEDLGDGWTPSTPDAEGVGAAQLQSAMEMIRGRTYPGVDSMVVARHGRLIAEGYFNGYARDTLHDLRSTGKSVTSALAGIAIEQGLFAVDDPISLHVPQFDRHDNMSARKRAIQVYHLLNMNSGLECNDWVDSSRGNEERMYDARDWVGFILDLPMAYDPGQASQYCTGGVVVLGYIISQRSGMALDAFANAYLFGPLGIQGSGWRRSPDGAATGGGGLRLTPRDARAALSRRGHLERHARAARILGRAVAAARQHHRPRSLRLPVVEAHVPARQRRQRGQLFHVGQWWQRHLRAAVAGPRGGVHRVELQLVARRAAAHDPG